MISTEKLFFGTLFYCILTTALLSADKKILFLAGEPSHGWNAHEFVAGSELLARCLNESELKVNAYVLRSLIISSSTLDDIACLVLYTDGEDLHIAKGLNDTLRLLHDQGTGIVVLHYALEGADNDMNQFYLNSIGGYFEIGWSVNPNWTPDKLILDDHPITSGVSSFLFKDEWYFHMRFRDNMQGIAPILSAYPTEATLGQDGPRSGNPTLREELKKRVIQHLAWAADNAEKGRGFALTGGNYHHNWSNDDFRKLVLNGIVWTAGLNVPSGGVTSKVSGLIRYKTISEAIARNDLDDVKRHMEKDPGVVNKLSRSKMTPLHEAIMRKRSDAALILLEGKANPNITTSSSQTSMHLAIDRNLPEIAAALLEVGVDLGVRDNQGWTALHLAAAKNRNDIAKLLIEKGADIKILSAAGGTPLHEAAVGAGADLIHLLLQAGIDPTLISDHDKSALDIAKTYGNKVAVEILSSL